MENKDTPASPAILTVRNPGNARYQKDFIDVRYSGLTKLEYASIQICAGGQSIPGSHNVPDVAARDAVKKAKALLSELEKEND